MRITTGIAGGREILVPKGELRPTQDKVRQALFSSLGEAVVGCRFLDLFAGSGAVGLEAWSRGAEFVCFLEQDARAVETIARNVEVLCVPKLSVQVLKMDAERFLERPMGVQGFDVVFADPPYRKDLIRSEVAELRGQQKPGGRILEPAVLWLEKVLKGVGAASMLNPRGVVVFEQGDREPVREVAGWSLLRERRYGAARLVMYQKAET